MALRRGVGLVAVLLLIAVLVSAALVLLVSSWAGRPPSLEPGSTLVVRVRGDLAEVEPGGVFGPLLPSRPTVRAIVEAINRARDDERIVALLVMPTGAPRLWGKTQEVRDAIAAFRTSGKPAVAYLEYGGDREYYLAAACDRIVLMPGSPLDLTGVASYELFLRGTFDRIGAYPDLAHVGDYKTATNTFTERGFTPAHREMAESLNRDAFDQLIEGIAEGRGLPVEDVRALVDRGPFLPEQALEAGLVDRLAYEDQLDDVAGIDGDTTKWIDLDDYARVRQPRQRDASRIAVIYVVGTLTTGRTIDSAEAQVAGSETLVEYVRKARADERVRAVVLRVDSPGGSAIASEVVWRELMLTRGTKPVIVSMSDMAASGGYYVAMPAHAIVAQPGTLTGSIGVLGGKVVTDGTLGKLGVTVDGVETGQHAGMHSPTRRYRPAERAKVEEQLQATYDQFIEKVAEARRSTPEAVDAIAQGRVWTGRQARDIGLVDELGGLDRALTLARQRARIPRDASIELLVYPPRRTLYQLVANPFGSGGARGALLSLLLTPDERRALAMFSAPFDLFQPGEPLALTPYVFVW
ncbi:MAG: signal peptide peptidase SppA [Acidobacteria bacterium]|nr:signal peptide peptidase SppA [Acidobacteriota bacterium]